MLRLLGGSPRVGAPAWELVSFAPTQTHVGVGANETSSTSR